MPLNQFELMQHVLRALDQRTSTPAATGNQPSDSTHAENGHNSTGGTAAGRPFETPRPEYQRDAAFSTLVRNCRP